MKKCPLCQVSVQTRIEQCHEDLNNHLENCEEFQKIFKRPKKYCPLCRREPKSSLAFHIKSKHFRDILGGSDSSDSSSESSEHSDTDPSKPTLRPLAAPASVASVGAAICLKIHFFFEGCYIEAAQNFYEV